MFLKNYTSEVPVSQTVHRIEQTLIRCGVAGITKEYASTKGEISAITFNIKLLESTMTVRLPADVEKAQDALWKDYAGSDKLSANGTELYYYHGRKKKKKKDFREQAERTAWKIIQDWVEVQMSMIQMQQAEFQEVFLPYIVCGNDTFYHRVKEGGYRALLPETT